MARSNCSPLPFRAFVFVAVIFAFSASPAGEFRLKNGTLLKGNIYLMSDLGGKENRFDKQLAERDSDPKPQLIVMVDNDWQKYYVPRRQIPDAINDSINATPVVFDYKLLKRDQSKLITTVGSIVAVTEFNEFGQRTITLASQRGNLDVIQAISRIAPDHVVLDGLNYNWKMGVSLKAIPPDVLDKVIRQKVKSDDAFARFKLVSFYAQAEMYPEAFKELDAILAAFPDQKARVNGVRAELSDYFGREVLRELNRRRAAGQHRLASDFAVRLTSQQLGGAVMDSVKKFIRDYEDQIKAGNRAKNLLVEMQAKLTSKDQLEKLQPLRTEINEQLDLESLPRMDAFLQAETDPRLTIEQRLALAYSGWVVGAANAITDLNLAIRYWDARHSILEAVRAETVQDRDERFQELRRVEGVGPRAVLQLTAFLPAILDIGEIRPGEVHKVQVTPEGQTPSISYSVLLPPEYSPNHSYPLLIALRSRDHSVEETIKWWGGTAEQQGPSMRRGYIVIAPDYVDDKQAEYNYSLAAHTSVIESLRDARKRFSVDSNRVFLAGHGIGADAAFDLGMAHPDEFAGVIPIGGECQHYPARTYLNGQYTSWYVIGRGYSKLSRDQANVVPQTDQANNEVFKHIFINGARFDFMLVEYLGRGMDRHMDEVPKLFDWMDLHVRKPAPTQFEVKTLRKTDNRYFWLTVLDLPRNQILPAPQGTTITPPMEIVTKVVKGDTLNTDGNFLRISSPGKRYIVRLTSDMIDFEKRLKINKDGRAMAPAFVTPDSAAILDELRATGDRTRLPLATLTLEP
ncbi:MAG: hypothetical protein JSS49_10795 [Planctomycetes bacterium]|nr:hypothetical protein [Planctomycetota bacterium]